MYTELIEREPGEWVLLSAASDPGDPKTWEESQQTPEAQGWREATISEIQNFLNRDAWKKVSKSSVKAIK